MIRLVLALCLLIGLSPGAFPQSNFAPRAPTGNLTLVAGGTAQNFQNAGNYVACVVTNPTTAAEQGIGAAEAIWVNAVTAASASAGATSIPVEAGQSMTFGPTLQAISWIAATTGHKVSGYCQ